MQNQNKYTIQLSIAFGLIVALVNGCSFHPARRVPYSEVQVKKEDSSELIIKDANTFQDNGILCVEGLVEFSDKDAHSHRGAVTVKVFSKSGTVLEEKKNCLYSPEHQSGSKYSRIVHQEHEMRFDVELETEISKVSAISVRVNSNEKGCE